MAPSPDVRTELAGRIMGFILSQAVYVATRLGIADRVADAPVSARELAEEVGAEPDALYRLLRLLAGYGIFAEEEGGAFTNTEASSLLREGAGTFREFALVFGEEFYPAFAQLLQSIRTGEPAFDAVFGAPWDDYLAAHPEKSTRFNRFMAGDKGPLAEVLLADGWRGDETVVDIGGGVGALLQALLERAPGLRGVVFDLPHVAIEAEDRLDAAGLTDRCQVVAGSYFDAVPKGGDVYLLSHILHGWDDGRAAEILRAIRRATRHAPVLIIDGVVAPPNEPGQKLMDLLMLTVGGRERTEDEWRGLLENGGFRLAAIKPAPFGSVLRAEPA